MGKNIRVDIENLEPEKQRQLLALIEEANKPKVKPDTRWKPEVGEEYWFIDENGNIYQEDDNYTGCLNDMYRFEMGNCFKTAEEAAFEKEHLKVLQELRRFASDKNGSLDAPYFLFYDPCTGNSIGIGTCTAYSGELRFKTKEDAKMAINTVGEERIKKYYFRVKEK